MASTTKLKSQIKLALVCTSPSKGLHEHNYLYRWPRGHHWRHPVLLWIALKLDTSSERGTASKVFFQLPGFLKFEGEPGSLAVLQTPLTGQFTGWALHA